MYVYANYMVYDIQVQDKRYIGEYNLEGRIQLTNQHAKQILLILILSQEEN